MCGVFLRGFRKDQDVVDVREAEVQPMSHFIDETLERLACVAQSEGHIWEFEEPKRRRDRCFENVLGIDRDLLIRFYQVDR